MISTEPTPTQTSALVFTRKKLAFSVAVLLIFHAVGFWGLVFSGNPGYYQNLTPMNLMLTSFLLFLNHRNFDKYFWLFVAVTFTAGFLAEVLGVHTGLLFGNYAYGQALGFKLWEVPLIIGLNWVMLVYSSGILVRTWSQNPVICALIATVFMVSLDYFIEPVAMQFDFWSWQQNQVPVLNYAGWFGITLALQLLFQVLPVDKTNQAATWVFLVQAAFFIALNLFL